uniref:Late embryogenesis abundant protein LEA-2 subgroup domain-containing protein n=2 Tax=Oryza brachyantha TaxID=4533 RepID=J3MS57_ORYBR
MSVAQLDVSASDLSVYARLVASVSAENPNDMIGIRYGPGSRTVVSYRGTVLCSGRLPAFYQGHRNTTVMVVAMEGRHGFGSGLQSALEESENAGNVPLDVYVSVPLTLRLGDVDLREVTVNVHCALVVDSLSPKKKPAIKSAQYKFNAEF